MASVKQFARDRRGSSAVEFALVSFFLIMTIMFVMGVALVLYEGEALDYATSKAARQIMTGQVQTNVTTQSGFRTAVLCPFLPAAMSCGNVIINVQTITEARQPGGYYALVNASATALNMPTLAVDAGTYSVGTQGSFEYVQVIYPVTFLPGFFSKMLGGATYNGSPAFLLVSTATFKNEQYN